MTSVPIEIERLSGPHPEPGPVAAALLAGRLAPDGVRVATALDQVVQPAERFDPDERAHLAERLEAGLSPYEPPVAVLDAARSIGRPDACFVVTGQQPGFLASPLFCIYKALQAVRLARSLAQAWEVPVVPLFWNHADDHDVAEVHHAHVLNPNLDVQRIGLAGMQAGRQPLSRVRLTEEQQDLTAVKSLLLQSHEKFAHCSEAVELLMPRDGDSFASAFTRSMTQLLGHLGLVVLEPDWLREDLSRALAHVVAREPARHMAAAVDDLREGGLEPAIDPSTAALVFGVDRDGRQPLRSGGEGFRYDDEPGSRTGVELAAEIVQDPGGFSAGALLRPLAQDLALPVAAYVGGWGELAYHAQLGRARRAADVPTPAFVPRASMSLVDGELDFALGRLEVGATDVIEAGGDLARLLGDEDDRPPAVVEALREIGERAAREIGAQRSALAEVDPSLVQALRRTADALRTSVEKLLQKVERSHQNRSGKGRRHQRRVLHTLFPRERPQERVLGPLTFLARYGRGWIDELLAGLAPFEPGHLVVHLGTLPTKDEDHR